MSRGLFEMVREVLQAITGEKERKKRIEKAMKNLESAVNESFARKKRSGTDAR